MNSPANTLVSVILLSANSVLNQQSADNSLPINPARGYQAAPPNQFSGQHNKGQKNVEDMVLDTLHLPSNRLSIKNLIEEGAIYEAITDHYKSIING